MSERVRGIYKLVVGALCVAAAGAVTAPAQARPKTEADKLFDEGTRLMDQRRFSEACPKFAQSMVLDPGLGVMLWLADCYERDGQTASSWVQFRQAMKLAEQDHDKRAEVARRRMNELQPRLSRITITLAGPRPDGLRIMRDHDTLADVDIGSPIPIDPGTHVISATAPHHKPFEKSVEVPGCPVLKDPDKERSDCKGPSVEVQVTLEPEAVATTPPPPPPPKSSGTVLRIAGLGVAGAGVVGITLGSVFGLVASGKLNDSNANNHCDAQNACDPVGLQLRQDANDAATISTIAFVAGGVALAGGLVMFFVAPHAKKTETGGVTARVDPLLGPGLAGVSVGGSF